MDATALIIQLVFTFIFAAALVGWFTWPASRANWPVEVVQWAQGHALQLTLRNRAMVVYYVRLSITLRVIGGVGGLVIGALFDDATGLDTSSGAGFWIWIVLGWLVGASWAEYRLTRPPSTGHAASLTPREVLDYLPARLYAAPVVAAGVAVLLAAIGLLAPDPAAPPLHPLPPTAGLVLGAIGAILIAVAHPARRAGRGGPAPTHGPARHRRGRRRHPRQRRAQPRRRGHRRHPAHLQPAGLLRLRPALGGGRPQLLAPRAARVGSVRRVAVVGLPLLARSAGDDRGRGAIVIIRLDPDSAVPPYAQLHDQLATMIRSGVLAPGARLPAIRHLANDLGVAINTVGRAYRELELDDLVASRGRHGTTVLEPTTNVPARRAEMATAATSFAIEAKHRGLDLDQALAAVRTAFVRLDQTRGVMTARRQGTRPRSSISGTPSDRSRPC